MQNSNASKALRGQTGAMWTRPVRGYREWSEALQISEAPRDRSDFAQKTAELYNLNDVCKNKFHKGGLSTVP